MSRSYVAAKLPDVPNVFCRKLTAAVEKLLLSASPIILTPDAADRKH